ncbi:MAG: tetratricopeptide repeat protein [Oscillibacter sp.]|nr:tetratricopeptide repeat protein [Oscillibacter sp.]
MDWTLLGIEPTKDKKAITAAYRSQLTSVNPEDKPEQFKALRAAYEQALHLADQEEAPPVQDESPVGLWMEQVRMLYDSFPARIRPEKWQQLLQDDVCIALDKRPLAEEALLKFLLEDFYLPQQVWTLLDETFSWSQRRGELYEHYPRDFVDYAVLNGIRYPASLPYELFNPGLNGKDCDQYRRLYHRANQVPAAEMGPILDEMAKLSERHPYGDALSFRLQIETGNVQQGRQGFCALAEAYPNDATLTMAWAAQCISAEDWAEVEKLTRRVLELRPEHAQAKHALADCLAKQGQYEEAKQLIFQLMDAAGGDQKRIYELRNVIRDWNQALIQQREARLQQAPEDMKNRIKLAWCYLQNDQDKEALELGSMLRHSSSASLSWSFCR